MSSENLLPPNKSTNKNHESFIFDASGRPSFRVVPDQNNSKPNNLDRTESKEFKSFNEHYDYEKSRLTEKNSKNSSQNEFQRSDGKNSNANSNENVFFVDNKMEKNLTFGKKQPTQASPNKFENSNEKERITFGDP